MDADVRTASGVAFPGYEYIHRAHARQRARRPNPVQRERSRASEQCTFGGVQERGA
ncbi:hypothetical protein [Streptomyces sp. V1I1]|uniref:hypothetical protein n=1 Tax=Streptomyces sp. V1I1 TaxID=3042272 RepID=UPI0027D90988|nr:hypothetical protein [Streptomyces sp. V1I1]